MDKEKKPCRIRPKNYLGSQQVLQSNACDENLDTRSYLNSRAIRTLSEFCAGIFLWKDFYERIFVYDGSLRLFP